MTQYQMKIKKASLEIMLENVDVYAQIMWCLDTV